MAGSSVDPVDPVTEQAHEWRLRLAQAELSEAERRNFEIWLAADLRHEEAYDRAVTLTHALGTLGRAHYDARLSRLSRTERLSLRLERARRMVANAGLPIALGASAMAALGVLVALPMLQGGPAGDGRLQAHVEAAPTTRRLASDTGRTLTVTLEDGSVATLGAASEIEIAMRPDRRDVRLIAGAVLLEVAEDAARPFSVSAGKLTATALGTVFDVRNNAGVVRVAVSEGAVKVVHSLAAPGADGEAAALTAQRTLEAGQQIAATKEGLHKARSIQKSLVGAWCEARLDYAEAPLAELVADANRYSSRSIEIDDPSRRLSGASVTATFDGDNIERMLAILPDIMPVAVDRSDPQRIVIRPSS